MAIHTLSTPAPRRRARPASRPAALPGVPFLSLDAIPPRYGMQLSGDCLAPELNHGVVVVFARDEPVTVGQFCVFILRPELVRPGGLQCCIKRLVMAPPAHVTFPWREHPKSEVHALVVAEQFNPPRSYGIRCADLLAVHPMVGRQ